MPHDDETKTASPSSPSQSRSPSFSRTPTPPGSPKPRSANLHLQSSPALTPKTSPLPYHLATFPVSSLSAATTTPAALRPTQEEVQYSSYPIQLAAIFFAALQGYNQRKSSGVLSNIRHGEQGKSEFLTTFRSMLRVLIGNLSQHPISTLPQPNYLSELDCTEAEAVFTFFVQATQQGGCGKNSRIAYLNTVLSSFRRKCTDSSVLQHLPLCEGDTDTARLQLKKRYQEEFLEKFLQETMSPLASFSQVLALPVVNDPFLRKCINNQVLIRLSWNYLQWLFGIVTTNTILLPQYNELVQAADWLITATLNYLQLLHEHPQAATVFSSLAQALDLSVQSDDAKSGDVKSAQQQIQKHLTKQLSDLKAAATSASQSSQRQFTSSSRRHAFSIPNGDQPTHVSVQSLQAFCAKMQEVVSLLTQPLPTSPSLTTVEPADQVLPEVLQQKEKEDELPVETNAELNVDSRTQYDSASSSNFSEQKCGGLLCAVTSLPQTHGGDVHVAQTGDSQSAHGISQSPVIAVMDQSPDHDPSTLLTDPSSAPHSRRSDGAAAGVGDTSLQEEDMHAVWPHPDCGSGDATFSPFQPPQALQQDEEWKTSFPRSVQSQHLLGASSTAQQRDTYIADLKRKLQQLSKTYASCQTQIEKFLSSVDQAAKRVCQHPIELLLPEADIAAIKNAQQAQQAELKKIADKISALREQEKVYLETQAQYDAVVDDCEVKTAAKEELEQLRRQVDWRNAIYTNKIQQLTSEILVHQSEKARLGNLQTQQKQKLERELGIVEVDVQNSDTTVTEFGNWIEHNFVPVMQARGDAITDALSQARKKHGLPPTTTPTATTGTSLRTYLMGRFFLWLFPKWGLKLLICQQYLLEVKPNTYSSIFSVATVVQTHPLPPPTQKSTYKKLLQQPFSQAPQVVTGITDYCCADVPNDSASSSTPLQQAKVQHSSSQQSSGSSGWSFLGWFTSFFTTAASQPSQKNIRTRSQPPPRLMSAN